MYAKILPLDKKYYGTQILFSNEKHVQIVEFSIRGDNTPSKRELEKLGISLEDYLNNSKLEYFEEPYGLVRDLFTDEHYETQDCLNFCKEIVSKVNRNE